MGASLKIEVPFTPQFNCGVNKVVLISRDAPMLNYRSTLAIEIAPEGLTLKGASQSRDARLRGRDRTPSTEVDDQRTRSTGANSIRWLR